MSYKLRKPNKKELEDLRQYLLGLGQDEETVEIILTAHFFGVIDDYISDCPAYSGKLMFAIYGMPEFYEVFIWEDEKIAKIELDDGFVEGIRKSRYLKNLTDEQLAEEFDSYVDKFVYRHNIKWDKLQELMVGWIDYKYSKMGELEKEINKLIAEVENGENK